MVRQGKYMLCTVSELVAELSKGVCKKNAGKSKFKDVNFFVPSAYVSVDEYDGNVTLEEIAQNDGGWYGIKAIDTGFNDDEGLTLCADYYGGGSVAFGHLWGECSENEIRSVLKSLIFDTLISGEGTVGDATLLIAEFKPVRVEVKKIKKGAF